MSSFSKYSILKWSQSFRFLYFLPLHSTNLPLNLFNIAYKNERIESEPNVGNFTLLS